MIHLSDHLPSDGSAANPTFQQLLKDNPGETFLLDTVARLRSGSRYGLLRCTVGQSIVGPGSIISEDIGANVASRRVITGKVDGNGMPAHGLVFRDFSIESHTPDPTGQSALFHFSGGEDGVTIEGVRMLRNEGGDAAYFGGGCDDFTVEDCVAWNYWRHGLVAAGGGGDRQKFIFRNNRCGEDATWHRPRRPSIKAETTSNGSTNHGVRVVGNKCSGQIQVAFGEGEITGNMCHDMAITRSRGLEISHNRIRRVTASGYAVLFAREQVCDFSDNVIETYRHGGHVERFATAAGQQVEWTVVNPDAKLTGAGNIVIQRDPTGVPWTWKQGRSPVATMEQPEELTP